MGPRAQKGGEYHHGDLREALIAASLQLIEEGGVQALSLRKAARQAGVSSAAPYHHFQNRSALLAAIACEGFKVLGTRMEEMSADLEDPGDRLLAAGEAYVAFAQAHSAYFRVMFRPELADPEEFPELEAVGRPIFESLVQLVLEGQAAGTVPEGDPQRFVLLAWSAAHGISSLAVDGPLAHGVEGLDFREDELGTVVASTLRGLFRDASIGRS